MAGKKPGERKTIPPPPPSASADPIDRGAQLSALLPGRGATTLAFGSARGVESDSDILQQALRPSRRPSGSIRAPSPSKPKLAVALVGLGAMGRAIATRLVTAGYALRVFNRTRAKARGLAGITLTGSPAECATGADVVLTMVSDATALHDVLEGRHGVLANFGAEKRKHRPILVDMSTVGARAAHAVATMVTSAGGRFVDAPVSGSVGPAERGELVALVGGSVKAVERVRPILDVLCKKVIHAGGTGQGQTLKVVLNGLGAHHFVGLTSMLALGTKAGLARDILLDAFTSGAFATPSYLGARDKILARDFTPSFALSLALKDCALNVALQEELGVTLPVVRAILADVERGVREGLGGLDLYALEKHYTR